MPDGREEREERRNRIDQEKAVLREDGLELNEPDEWEPERDDS